MIIINLTPHAISIKKQDGSIINIDPSGSIARCEEYRENAGIMDGIGVTRATYGAVTGLPEPIVGTIYITSALTLAAVPNRADVFAPGPAIRDGDGKIIGCDGLTATAAYTPSNDEEILRVGLGLNLVRGEGFNTAIVEAANPLGLKLQPNMLVAVSGGIITRITATPEEARTAQEAANKTRETVEKAERESAPEGTVKDVWVLRTQNGRYSLTIKAHPRYTGKRCMPGVATVRNVVGGVEITVNHALPGEVAITKGEAFSLVNAAEVGRISDRHGWVTCVLNTQDNASWKEYGYKRRTVRKG